MSEQQSAEPSDREAQQAGQPEPSDLPEDEPDQASQPSDGLDDTDMPERQAAMEQWLRRIPDDPGGLLRRKFLYQYSNRHRRKERVDEPW